MKTHHLHNRSNESCIYLLAVCCRRTTFSYRFRMFFCYCWWNGMTFDGGGVFNQTFDKASKVCSFLYQRSFLVCVLTLNPLARNIFLIVSDWWTMTLSSLNVIERIWIVPVCWQTEWNGTNQFNWFKMIKVRLHFQSCQVKLHHKINASMLRVRIKYRYHIK